MENVIMTQQTKTKTKIFKVVLLNILILRLFLMPRL